MATDVSIMTGLATTVTMDNHTENISYFYNDTAPTTEPLAYNMKDRLRHLVSEPHKCIALALGFIAITLNMFSLLAISQIKNRITNHYRLIISLALSDIVIGASVVLFCLHTIVNDTYYPGYGPTKERIISRCMSLIVKSLNSTGLIISLLNLLGMALDHYLAIIRPLHYPSLFDGKKSYLFFIFSWCLAAILGFSDFFTGWLIYMKGSHTRIYNYCEACFLSRYQDEYMVYTVTGITTFVMVFIYVRLYIKIKNYRSPGQVIQSTVSRKNSTRSDIRRNKRALITTLLILGTFMICWIPNCILQISLLIQFTIDPSVLKSWSPVLYHTGWYMYDLMLINSIADPIIYAVRVFDVQLGYRRLMRRCCPRIKTLLYDDYMVRTNLIDRKTSSLKKNGRAGERPGAVELQQGAGKQNGSVRQALVPQRGNGGRESGSSSSGRSSNEVSVHRCQSAP